MDILVQEQGSGGEIIVRNNDIVMVTGFENMPYLAHFGGDAWFMNDLLTGDITFTGTTERLCRETPATSAGRKIIEDAMIADLSFLTEDVPGTIYSVSVAITSTNTFTSTIKINGQTFTYNWNPDASFLNYQV